MSSAVRSLEYVKSFKDVSDHFEIIDKCGQGTFASVFTVKSKHCDKTFAMKMIIPTIDLKRIENELRILKRVGGKYNVIELLAANRIQDHLFLLMPHFPHDNFSDYYLSFNEKDIQRYMINLLKALAFIHHNDIIHRDIKPSNFLYNATSKQFKLVDFGLAHSECLGDVDEEWERKDFSVKRKSMIERKESLPNSIKKSRMSTGIFGENIYPLKRNNSISIGNNRNRISHAATSSTSNTGISAVFGSAMNLPNMALDSNRNEEDCHCEKRLAICKICKSFPKAGANARRGGTIGFRPPEVMMRCVHQTVAIDIWAAGVIFLCFLTGRYPFVKVDNDLDVLHMFCHLLGANRIKEAARSVGKRLIIDPLPADEPSVLFLSEVAKQIKYRDFLKERSINIRKNERRFKIDTENNKDSSTKENDNKDDLLKAPKVKKKRHISLQADHVFPNSSYDLLFRMLEPNPSTRITARDALRHVFLSGKPLERKSSVQERRNSSSTQNIKP